MAIKTTLLAKVERCINSASETLDNRGHIYNVGALSDIESDLKDALDAVRKLIAINITERNAGL